MEKSQLRFLLKIVFFAFVSFFLCGTNDLRAQSGLLFTDDFVDNRNDWPSISSEIAETGVRDGYLFLQHIRTMKSLSVKKKVAINENADFMIVAEIVKFDLHKDPGFGILWGRESENNEYNFLISAKGNFKILRMFKGKPQTIVDWHPNKYINQGTARNRLSIKKIGNDMFFYINHHQVARTQVMPFFGDLVGIKVYHAQKVGVDSFKVYQRQ